jgi:para-nitrobenzyl esterase
MTSPLAPFVVGFMVFALTAGCSIGPLRSLDDSVRAVPDRETRRVTPSGEWIGIDGPYGSHAWLGIPFAQPPVGELRWRAPRPPKAAAGLQSALTFGSPCRQFASLLGGIETAEPGDPVGSEDCLCLNIYAPRFEPGRVPSGDKRLPVMFWIHGGGNTIGAGSLYNGGNLAVTHDVLVVTTNYRLGPFGWFRHPALDSDGTKAADRSGNYGTLDLIRALSWVQENITAFGGDPGNVTIFGESAGGANVYSLLASPLAKGLFHRAIAQSAGTGSYSLVQAKNYVDAAEPGHQSSSREIVLRLLIQEGTARDRETARKEAARMSDAETERFLRGKTSVEILQACAEGPELGMFDVPDLIRDGYVLPEADLFDLLAHRGGYNEVPVILGSNRDENKLFMLYDRDQVRWVFGLFPRLRDEERYNLRADYLSRMWKAGAVDEPATQMRQVQGPSVFAYRFDWREEPKILWSDLSVQLGAAHGLEIAFVFGHFDLGSEGARIFTSENGPGRKALSSAMMSYWTEFAYNGDPGRGRDGRLPRWAPWDNAGANTDKFIVLDTEAGGGIRMSSDAVSKAIIQAEIESDPRLVGKAERCELLAELATWPGRFTEEDYAAAGCGGDPEVAGAPQ